jgi:hypothetical protein
MTTPLHLPGHGGFDSSAEDRFTSEGAPAPAAPRLAAERAATINVAIGVLQQRVARAEADRDTWRSSGMGEKHLEACSMVDALNLQLDDLQRSARRIAKDPRT